MYHTHTHLRINNCHQKYDEFKIFVSTYPVGLMMVFGEIYNLDPIRFETHTGSERRSPPVFWCAPRVYSDCAVCYHGLPSHEPASIYLCAVCFTSFVYILLLSWLWIMECFHFMPTAGEPLTPAPRAAGKSDRALLSLSLKTCVLSSLYHHHHHQDYPVVDGSSCDFFIWYKLYEIFWLLRII